MYILRFGKIIQKTFTLNNTGTGFLIERRQIFSLQDFSETISSYKYIVYVYIYDSSDSHLFDHTMGMFQYCL